MKFIICLSAVVLLVCCKKPPSSGGLEAHVKSNRIAIHRVVEDFERSEYNKISFGSPDFVTLIDSSGKIQEIEVDRVNRNLKAVKASSEFKSEVLSYIEQFEGTGIQSLEKSAGIYVEFSEGSRLLISKGSAEEIARLLHGKSSVEIYPGWYIFFE